VLTGSESELYLIRMIRKGANGYLLKSCHPAEIKQALISINQNGNYYSDVATSKFFHQVKTGVISLPDFTEMQLEFLRYCPTDLGYDRIADKMKFTEKALESCKTRVCDKLQLEDKHRTRVNLAMYAIDFGLFHPELKK
jgi:DNA-binding NarL/FixJ family response regulator